MGTNSGPEPRRARREPLHHGSPCHGREHGVGKSRKCMGNRPFPTLCRGSELRKSGSGHPPPVAPRYRSRAPRTHCSGTLNAFHVESCRRRYGRPPEGGAPRRVELRLQHIHAGPVRSRLERSQPLGNVLMSHNVSGRIRRYRDRRTPPPAACRTPPLGLPLCPLELEGAVPAEGGRRPNRPSPGLPISLRNRVRTLIAKNGVPRDDANPVPQTQIPKGLSQFGLEPLKPRGVDGRRQFDADPEVVQRPELGQNPDPEPVPDFGRVSCRGSGGSLSTPRQLEVPDPGSGSAPASPGGGSGSGGALRVSDSLLVRRKTSGSNAISSCRIGSAYQTRPYPPSGRAPDARLTSPAATSAAI